jgi:hypothetical protein
LVYLDGEMQGFLIILKLNQLWPCGIRYSSQDLFASYTKGLECLIIQN